jgi:hypothetical protein
LLGLLLKPFQTRDMNHLGANWERYKGQYRPQSEPTKEERLSSTAMRFTCFSVGT